ncbi:MAG: universal stress protein [Desulfobacterales bacterium]|nr:universal stress protein [Desulfobacterales bacterium]
MIDPSRSINEPRAFSAGEIPGPAAAAPQKALVAIKNSTPALHAFIQTMQMSRRLHFPVAALTVAPFYDGDLAFSSVGASPSAWTESTGEILDEALAIAVAEGLGLETFRALGSAHEAILEFLRRGEFGLIVLGRGRHWTSPFNTAARVVRQSSVDALVIPEGWSARFKQIVCGVIGVPSGPVLDTAQHLASLDLGHVTLFTLGDDHRDSETTPPDSARLKVVKMRTPAELYRRLRGAAQSGATDMVVFAEAPSRGLWHSVALPPTVRLLLRSRCPLWVVKI